MSDIGLEGIPGIGTYIVAGRRAALGALLGAYPQATYEGEFPEDLTGPVRVQGVDISAGIDAAVIETLVRAGHQDGPPPQPKRRWWRFWR